MESNKIEYEQSIWFEKNTTRYEEVYVPMGVAKNINLHHNDKIAVKIKSSSVLLTFPARVRFREKKDGNIFRFQIQKETAVLLSGKVSFKIIKLLKPQRIKLARNEVDVANFCQNSNNISEWIDGQSIVLWDNMKCPIMIKRRIDALEQAKYLGLFYADGSKSNHYNCLCSTKAIAKVALTAYNSMIQNPRYSILILYRKTSDEQDIDIKERIYNHWVDIGGISKEKINIYGNKQTFRWSDNLGIFRMDDSRYLTLKFHLWLTKEVLKLGRKDHTILEEFLKGGLLGDGGVSNRRKESLQHIAISSNNKEYPVWEDICRQLKLKYSIKKEKSRDSVYLRLTNYHDSVNLYKKGIFNEYEKRRKKLLVGLKNRVETYIIGDLMKYKFQPKSIAGKFGVKTTSFFYVNKGGDLIKQGLISFNENSVAITDKGETFYEELLNLKVLEGA